MIEHGKTDALSAAKVGEMLPPFNLASTTGGRRGPADYKGRRNLVLYFAESLSCQECRQSLRDLADRHQELRDEETEVLVIVPAPPDQIPRARLALDLPFPVLADADRAVYARYGALTLDGRPASAVLVADRYGEIVAASEGVPDHAALGVDEILSWLRLIQIRCPE